ncbi:MAG: hypothetical protein J6U64_00925, partial [Alphaproteobacteria bacterium]|nr:hypothetical protein [Alphaproteobacteria bacterium]
DDDDDDDDDNLPELPVPGGGFCIWECALGIWDAEHKNITPKPNAIVKLPSSCLIPEDINDTEEVLEYDGICKCEDGYTVMAIAESVEGTIYQSSTVLCCKYPCGTTDCCEKEGECVLTDNSGPEYRKGTCCPNGNGGLDEGGEVVCCDEDQAYEAAARGCCDKIDGAYPPILTEKEVKECYEIYAGDTDTNYCTVKRLKCDDNSECDGEGECKCNDGEAPCGWNFVGDTPMQQQCCSSD